MPKKTIFEEKETEPFLSVHQKNILFKFFIVFCFICLIGAISYFSFLGIRSLYHKYSCNRELIGVTYEDATYAICDKRKDTHSVYRTDTDGKLHLAGMETDYYIYYIDEKLNVKKRKSVSSDKYHCSTKVIVRYKYETVIYTAKFPDEYRGDKVLNQPQVETFVDRIGVL